MRRGGARLLVALAAPLALGAAKPTLVPDVSESRIEIQYSFTGAELLLFGEVSDGARIIVDADGEQLSLRVAAAEQVH